MNKSVTIIDCWSVPRKKKAMAFLLFLLLGLSSVIRVTYGKSFVDTARRTLPAYAIALNAASTMNSSTCRSELGVFRDALDIRKLWALKALDSSGEPYPGFLYGNNYWLGSRAQCFDTANANSVKIQQDLLWNASKFRKIDEESSPYKFNYFVANFRHNSTLQYHIALPNEDVVTLGLCLPASCTSDELSPVLRKTFQNRTMLISQLYAADFELLNVVNLHEDRMIVNERMIFFGSILAITLILMIAATAYDVLVYQKYLRVKRAIRPTSGIEAINDAEVIVVSPESVAPEKIKRASLFGETLKCFSIYTNTKIIFGTKLGPDAIGPINGLRFLVMAWIIVVHTVLYMPDFMDNKLWLSRLSEDFVPLLLSNATLAVDTFFFLGGFLMAYLQFKPNLMSKTDDEIVSCRTKIIEFFGAIAKRFIRLTPAYMMAIGIVETHSAWYSDTSVFYMSERPQETCAKYWWRNLLYINNFFGREEMFLLPTERGRVRHFFDVTAKILLQCLSWSWYLSSDMQLYVLGTFLVMLSSIYFYTALTILVFILLGSTFLSYYTSCIIVHVPTIDNQINNISVLYHLPWMRVGPYIVGIIAAYIVVRLDNKLTIHKGTVVALWSLASACNLVILFGIWERQIWVFSAAFYVALSGTLWGVGLCWLLIACCTNHGGMMNTILSFKGWVPLSKLSYCAYLLHPFIIRSVYLHSETSVHLDILPILTRALGILISTYLFSYAYSLMMETPYRLVVRLFTKTRTQHYVAIDL